MWALSSVTPEALAACIARATPILDSYIDEQLDRYGLSEEKLVLIGFSQGTMMALHVGLRRQRQLAGIVGYSGMLVAPAALRHEMRSKPPILLIHGTADQVVPVQAIHDAEAELRRLGCPVTTNVSPGLAHGVDPTGLRLGADFVRRVLI